MLLSVTEIYKGKLKEKLIESSINWQIHNLGGRLEYISHETTDQVNRKYRGFKQHN